jgi:hypothetical protein
VKRIELGMLCLVVLLVGSMAVAGDSKPPADYVKDCQYYLGDWNTEAEIAGTVYRGTWIVRWSPNKTCLETHWTA